MSGRSFGAEKVDLIVAGADDAWDTRGSAVLGCQGLFMYTEMLVTQAPRERTDCRT